MPTRTAIFKLPGHYNPRLDALATRAAASDRPPTFDPMSQYKRAFIEVCRHTLIDERPRAVSNFR